MTSNPLSARRAEPVHHDIDLQFRCDQLNAMPLTEKLDKFYFVKAHENGTDTIECMDLPLGTKGWIRENEARVRGLIRKITGGPPQLVDLIYQRTLRAAPVPTPWDKMRVI